LTGKTFGFMKQAVARRDGFWEEQRSGGSARSCAQRD